MKKLTLLCLISILLLTPQYSKGQSQITLTSDQQLIDLLDPDEVIDLSRGNNKVYGSLRSVCESAKDGGHDMLRIKYDAFFRQFRNQPETDRLLTVDSEEYIEKMKIISDFASGYGLGLGLALLSPLELGAGYNKQTGKHGQWAHYKVGNRDPESGKFSVKLWQQLYWTNNKGKFDIKLKGVKAYAFREEVVPNTMFKAVKRDEIVLLKNIKYDQWEIPVPTDDSNMDIAMWDGTEVPPQTADRMRQIEVYCDGSEELQGYDRVMVLLEYQVPEMAYFDEETVPFMKDMLQRYKDAGINLIHLTNDEPHFQADWFYFSHHDNGQFALRYYTAKMGNYYEKLYGVPFEEKDLLYFACGPDINSNAVTANRHYQYVRGVSRLEIQKTFLFRDNYYKMLNNYLVDTFKETKDFASEIFGVNDWGTAGHSSWAESPTIDYWDTKSLHRNAYPHFWGHPEEAARRKRAVNNAFGGMPLLKIRPSRSIDLITGHVHRDVNILVLYPMNLVAVDERFGSWMTQYGYCNYITAEKLLELGSINENGEVVVKDKKYNTLVSMFEPLPNNGLLSFMKELNEKGGNTIWFGPPPVIDDKGKECLEEWESLFGVKYQAVEPMGRIAVGMRIDFNGILEDIPYQYILSDFTVDRIYPVMAESGTDKLAYCHRDLLVGTKKGNAWFFGFRPRDDQSASLGYETRTLFEILDHTKAHQPTGKFAGVNDNTEHVSRKSDYFCTRFPNGATVVVRHYNDHRENWGSGNSRDKKEDSIALAANPVPTDTLNLDSFKVNGHEVNFNGTLSMAFRNNDKNELIAFKGENCRKVAIDGISYNFSDKLLEKIAFAPSLDNENELMIYIEGESTASIPLPSERVDRITGLQNETGKRVKYGIENNSLILELDKKSNSQWLSLSWE